MNSLTIRPLFLALALLLASPSPAALAQSAVWSEDAALARYRAESPRLAAARQQVNVARAVLVGAGRFPNPTLDLGREQVFTPDGPTEQNRLGLQAVLPLAGRLGLERARAEAGVAAAAARAEAAVFALESGFREIFMRAWGAEARSSVLEEAISAYERLEKVVAARHRAGEIAGYELMRVRLGRAAVESSWQDVRSEAARERARLAGELGAPIGGPLAAAPIASVPAGPVIVDLALARKPELLALAAERRAAEAALALGERLRWPDPELAVGFKQTNEPTVRGLGYTAGLLLPLPMFTHGQGERALAEAELARIEAEAEAARSRLEAEIPAARAVFADRLAFLRRFEAEVLASTPQLVATAELAYREGAQGIVALIDAQQAVIEARLMHLELLTEARLARLELERLAGGPLPPQADGENR